MHRKERLHICGPEILISDKDTNPMEVMVGQYVALIRSALKRNGCAMRFKKHAPEIEVTGQEIIYRNHEKGYTVQLKMNYSFTRLPDSVEYQTEQHA